jgi:hypothetical protein
VSPVNYELGFYILEDAILHSECRENFNSYIVKALSISHVSCACLAVHFVGMRACCVAFDAHTHMLLFMCSV